jgi:hypothetical protein
LFGRVVGEHPVGTTRRERYGKTDTDASPQMGFYRALRSFSSA